MADEPNVDANLDEAGKPADSGKPSGEPSAKPDAAKPADGSAKAPADGTPKPGDEKPADVKPDTQKLPAAPEKYETFKVPDGVKFEGEAVEKFSALSKELGLTQEAAQKLVDFQANATKVAQEQQKADFDAMKKTWAEDTRKALGADAEKQLGFAAQAREKFATPELKTLLEDSGFTNHPEIAKLFISIGKAISEDGFVSGKPADGPKDPAKVMYPNQGK